MWCLSEEFITKMTSTTTDTYNPRMIFRKKNSVIVSAFIKFTMLIAIITFIHSFTSFFIQKRPSNKQIIFILHLNRNSSRTLRGSKLGTSRTLARWLVYPMQWLGRHIKSKQSINKTNNSEKELSQVPQLKIFSSKKSRNSYSISGISFVSILIAAVV